MLHIAGSLNLRESDFPFFCFQVSGPWKSTFDLVVLGGGPGGYTAAIRASQLGMKTAVVENDRLGGVCLNWGCVPTKALLRNAEVLHLLRKSDEWGITIEKMSVDFPRIIKRSRGIAERISKGVEFLMKKNAIEVIYGTGKLAGDGRIVVTSGEETPVEITAHHLIVATGARPRSLPGVPFDGDRIISSKEAMSLAEQPKSLIIVGAGAIGIEFAYFYNALGTKVTVLEMLPSILPIEDREVTKQLETSLRRQGIDIRTGTRVEAVDRTEDGATVTISRGSEKEHSDRRASPRRHRRSGERGRDWTRSQQASILERGYIKVDEQYRSSASGVYAIGDVIGPPWLAHVASAEGICLRRGDRWQEPCSGRLQSHPGVHILPAAGGKRGDDGREGA